MFFNAIPFGAWSFSASGPTGIRPEAVREVRSAKGVTLAQWRAMFDDLQVMEAEALKTMHEARDG